MLNAKNQVHKALRTATSLVGRTSAPLASATQAPPPLPKQPRNKYQAYTAVDESEFTDEDYRIAEEQSHDNYYDDEQIENDYDGQEFGLTETERGSPPFYRDPATERRDRKSVV